MINNEVERTLNNRCKLPATADYIREQVGEHERGLTGEPPSPARRGRAPKSPRRRIPLGIAA